jgi:SAM-dependent methyltransferase
VALTLNQARSVYDRIGRVQDCQACYEDGTINRLVAKAAFAGDQTIFEFSCGTGQLAARLLAALPSSFNYLGVDISPVMINLATSRLVAWTERAKVVLVDGKVPGKRCCSTHLLVESGSAHAGRYGELPAASSSSAEHFVNVFLTSSRRSS